jgi:DNA-binding GntR family transcriptional regulator
LSPAKAKVVEARYAQIARDLKEKIANGTYPVGTSLPTEEKLSERYAVSRNTVREALRQLRETNLVASRRRAGTVVVPPQSSDSNFLHAMSINDVVNFSERWEFDTLSVKTSSINQKLGAWLGVPGKLQWLSVCGVSRTKGATLPECWIEYYINQEYSAVGRLLNRYPGPLITAIEDMFGVHVVELNQDISAALIPPEMAAKLEVKAGTPAIVVRRACRTADGKIVEAFIETYPAPRFRYSVTLRRAKASHGR